MEIDAQLTHHCFQIGRLEDACLLHIHIIARHLSDPCWPLPVWGFLEGKRGYSDESIRAITRALAQDLDLLPGAAAPAGDAS